ncbi:FtsX-like permease family protein [Inconstantimicrobium porci]|uniref:FtsX-like permease family protein n=1 Tax=Inconstantimicrobium porci TaxID=2652291 RepID=A0A7X2MZP2_9CLOT|nr:FtsX-like permease family protein [Inconstantimicrobium porci]MSR92003.1 FtsX-like permease family protein [Inconstantimicrobium porci]
MTLFSLSLKNIRKSMKDYAIYFFTLILGVAIFYVFNAIGSQTAMMNISSSKSEMMELMNSVLSGVSVLVALILGFLIIYASRFLIKRRNKEFGIYLTLGMSKRKISMILFFETFFIGIISLGVGLLLGFGLSQLMSLLVANMFEANMTRFKFTFSMNACIKTLIYFGIMYLLVMIFNTVSVNKCKLIDLLYANRKGEVVHLKNALLCTIIFIISSCALGYSYYMVSGGVKTMDTSSKLSVPIAIGAVSTFFIFWSLSGLILKICKSRKRSYYRGLNSFTQRQISSKINTTVFSMTIICLMLFVTICSLATSLTLKNSMTKKIKESAPVDIELTKQCNINKDKSYSSKVIDDSSKSIIYTLKNSGFNIDKNFKDVVEFNTYKAKNLTIKNTLGSTINSAKKEFQFLEEDTAEQIMKVSDYNRIAKLYNLETVSVSNDQYAVVTSFDPWTKIRNNALKNKPSIIINNMSYNPSYNKCKKGYVHLESDSSNIGIFVVPDDAVDESMKDERVMIANYNASDKKGKQSIENIVNKFKKDNYKINTLTTFDSKIQISDESVGKGALITFIAIYLGVIFLISSAAILALKELSESTDNKERFNVLRKIGTDERMLNHALFKQIGVFFMAPLLLAVIHAVFGIKFALSLFSTFDAKQLAPSIIMAAVVLAAIYGGYFLITYFCSKNIIRDDA